MLVGHIEDDCRNNIGGVQEVGDPPLAKGFNFLGWDQTLSSRQNDTGIKSLGLT